MMTSKTEDNDDSESQVCPEYFRWIHENLKPWKDTGISRETVEGIRDKAFFRLVVLNGRVYLKKYKDVPPSQSRDLYTIWGILQLLRKYPGKLPDLDIMFNCADKAVITSGIYHGSKAKIPPAIFHYCGDDMSFDIVFPDWSFWGWPEINVKPWDSLLEELREGNGRTNWTEREPYAYWKGNPNMSKNRRELLKCNVTDKQEWNARLYVQDWVQESKQGFKQSKLANQCTHRYKIYIEGIAWSVSMKYILACDSVTLLVNPKYYDFITRALIPMHHYWPVRDDGDKCRSIKYAVDWGNHHTEEAQAIGKAASKFILEDMKMDYVYDYMFHLLNEYGNLLKYKPTVPEGANEICLEALACPADGLKKEFLLESMVKEPSNKKPCTMPPPFDPSALQGILKEKEDSMHEVETWKRKYWENQSQ
ncbi:O-glucosyltransferase rumi homolog [Telopea speciosissima]|uniref:O-glucosyltransferase rumi homolog n=1 Tax=Telopea speciosissima TaxID=54955 RepID=UPI001CC4AC7C|nr:O-glucosyltransferase rumi homolog [Telopea speciosissima]